MRKCDVKLGWGCQPSLRHDLNGFKVYKGYIYAGKSKCDVKLA